MALDEGAACRPRIKISETWEKITNPGRKRLWRVYDASGHSIADLITLEDERPDAAAVCGYVDSDKPWKRGAFAGCTVKELQEPVMRDGRRVRPSPSLKAVRDYVRRQLEEEVWPEEQRFENPHRHYLDLSPAFYDLKRSLLGRG